jgi:hypothetical protein
MSSTLQPVSTLVDFYNKYLLVLSDDQIIKLRKIAIGMLSFSAFTDEEIHSLDSYASKDRTVH